MLVTSLRTALAAIVCTFTASTPAAAQCQAALSVARDGVSATSVAGRAYFAGGRDGAATRDLVDIYDAATATWTAGTLSIPRRDVAAVTLGLRAYFAGGARTQPEFGAIAGFSAVDVYDAATNTWSTAQLSRGRWGIAATAVGGVALFAGGSPSNGPPFPPIDVVDIVDAAGVWSTSALSTARGQLAATSVGNVALFAGGRCLGGAGCVGSSARIPGFSSAVDLYDATSGSWSTASLSQARYDLAATSVGNVALFAGGLSLTGPSAVVDLWDASTGLWTTAVLSEARSDLVAFTVDGYAVFVGGNSGSPQSPTPSAVADVYELATGMWHVTHVGVPRTDAAVTVVGDQALLGGGRTPNGITPGIERLPGLLADAYAPGNACPCGNDGTFSAGCANSVGSGGGLVPECAPDGGFLAAGLVPQQTAVLLAGTAATPVVAFGDGLLATGGALRRLAARTVGATGRVTWPRALARSAPPGPPWTGGVFRYLQVWYRDPASPCGSGVNLTNGLRAIVW